MQSVDVYKNGTWYSVSDGTYCKLLNYDNLGMAQSRAITDKGPMQHGESYVDQRLAPRIFELALGIKGTSGSDLEANKLAVLNLFKPRSGLVTIRFLTDAGVYRNVDCYFSGGLELGRGATDPLYIKSVVTMTAPDPTLYDPSIQSVNFALGGGAGSGAVPMAVPMAVGASTIDQSTTVANVGSWLSYPIIRITGPITDCKIENTNTDEELDFDGTTIASGHYYDIDCRYGYKTVKLDGATNKIADLSAGSDLATFHLAVDPEVAGGANNIRVTGSSVSTSTKVEITYYRRYIGI